MTTTTTTTTQTDEASLPKNPMRSTWYNKPEEELDFAQRLIRRLGVLPDEDKINQAPVAKKGDKVPYVSRRRMNVWTRSDLFRSSRLETLLSTISQDSFTDDEQTIQI